MEIQSKIESAITRLANNLLTNKRFGTNLPTNPKKLFKLVTYLNMLEHPGMSAQKEDIEYVVKKIMKS